MSPSSVSTTESSSFSRYSATWSASSGGNLDGLLLAGAPRAHVRRHVQEVHDPGHLVLGADRQVDRHTLRAELRTQRLEGAEEVGALAVEHVHVEDACEAELVGALPSCGRSAPRRP